MDAKFKFIDLFCGVGGFHQALTNLDGECVFASDIDKECRSTYFENYGLMPDGDITKIQVEEIPKFNVMCAGFPCQSFSKAGNRLGIEDARGTLFFDILRIADYHKPEYMILENVRNLAGHDNGRTWKTIYRHLTDIGYSLSLNPIIFSPHYIGIPQHRERVFILCKRNDLGKINHFDFKINKKRPCDINEILLPDDEIDFDKYGLENNLICLIEIWNEFIQGITTELPGFPVWADRLCDLDPDENIDEYPKWKKNFILKNNELFINNRHFLSEWLEKAIQLDNFKGSKAMFEWQAGKVSNPNIWQNIMQFRPSGLRVKPPTYFPALVAITQTSIVGEKKRYITPRECARLQSFPDSFILHKRDSIAYKQFGNSVNVKVVQMFADFLLNSSTFDISRYIDMSTVDENTRTQMQFEFTS